ncbi:DNA mismatch repair protein MutS, partial [Candidatus Sumerlaeota bacterium]|nr:DNA mismatch repair protein MutS [Candidatus Sumerlaeota bacterium]
HLDSKYFQFSEAREKLLRHFGVTNFAGFGIDSEEKFRAGISSAGAVIAYLEETQKGVVPHITALKVYTLTEYMALDLSTQRGLELLRNLERGTKEGTLLWVLDRTLTAMGGRLLRQWITQPLRDKNAIQRRLEAVREFYQNSPLRTQIKDALKGINDLERIIGRVSLRSANARDLLALGNSLARISQIISAIQNCTSTLLTSILQQLNPLTDLRQRVENTLVADPPLTLRDGGLIRNGVDPKLDELRSIMKDSRAFINQLLLKEKRRTGCQNLKIGYNKVFGYYIEITRANLRQPGVHIPEEYIRKQTLVNAERFITPELKEKEEIILNAEEKSKELEYQLFEALRQEVAGYSREIQTQARLIAELDCLLSLAEVAIRNDYCEPEITDGDEIHIEDGRHPVLELMNLDTPFVPNSTHIDNRENQILIITGPNMAGKSTYIRQVALITLMAHIGSFVPARKARICVVDRIFTRVGAMDYLAKGQSTFLVEMNETANILHNATSRSLVILDEIGRGTSTYDGLSIAWAVIEYLHNSPHCRPKTLFATHYHEVTELEEYLPRVKNYNVAVLEESDRIVFLYKIVRGSTDRSYGIYAARLAGIPPQTLERAREILQSLEDERSIDVRGPTPRHLKRQHKKESRAVQLSIFDKLTPIQHPVLKKLKELDINQLTPLQALQTLQQLIEDAKKEK